jgi:hypothetical protein
MKNLSCFVAAILALFVTTGFGVVEFKDGGVHTVNYTINDTVKIDYCAPLTYTTFNLVSGGAITSPYELQGHDTAIINIVGGSVYQITHHGPGIVNVSSGTVNKLCGSNIFTDQVITVTGGRVDYVNDGVGFITISGGSIGSLYLDGDGGVKATQQTSIVGTNFAINGVPVAYGTYFRTNYSSGTITGILANGDSLNTHFDIHYGASFTLVPEPTTMCLFALPGLLIRNKK